MREDMYTLMFGFIFISIILFLCLFHKDTRLMGIWYFVVVGNGILMNILWEKCGFIYVIIYFSLFAFFSHPKIRDKIMYYKRKMK